MNLLPIFLSVTFLSFQSFALQEGDLLFQDVDCGPFCDAIEKVTEGYKGNDLSHVGMVIDIGYKELQVIEATTEGVIITPVSSFLAKSLDKNGKPKVLVGRLKDEYKGLVSKAKIHALSLLGKEYDDVFDINNDSYYCSELVYESFKSANNDKSIFHLFPMTFVDPDTDRTFDIWIDYYKKLEVEIPEGKPGLNPGGMSRSDKLNIVHDYRIKGN